MYSSTASTAYPCPDTPRIVLFTLSLNMFCSPAGGGLVRHRPGLGVRKAEAAQDPPQRAGLGVPACLPPDHLVYHVQMPRCRFEPVPRGIPARPLHYLLENTPAQNPPPSSRLPVKPSAQAAPHHPDEPAADSRVRPHQFARDGPYSLGPPCACSRQPGCPWPCRGTTVPSCGKHSPCLCREEIRLPLEALLRCEPARVKVSCGCGTWTRIKIFRLINRHLKIQMAN